MPAAPEPAVTADPNGGAPLGLGEIPAALPGPAQLIWSGPAGTRQVAWTVDDGYCQPCIEGYVAFARATGIHLTMNPNGVFGELWSPIVVNEVRDMVANKQVQFGNHTWDHRNLTTLSNPEIANELNQNEQWIEDTFGVTARPYFRPPYGFYNDRVLSVAAEIGYTQALMWNGTFGDATLETPEQIIEQAEEWLQPGTIMLGHLNHTPILSLFGRIQEIIASRKLDPVTLDEMFGTSRLVG